MAAPLLSPYAANKFSSPLRGGGVGEAPFGIQADQGLNNIPKDNILMLKLLIWSTGADSPTPHYYWRRNEIIYLKYLIIITNIRKSTVLGA